MNEIKIDFKDLIKPKDKKLAKEIGLNDNEVNMKVEGRQENLATIIGGRKIKTTNTKDYI